MSEPIVLTNDRQRKEFLENYYLENGPWKLIREDEEVGLNFYRVTFPDGSFITAMDSYWDAYQAPIFTLTQPGFEYFPSWTTQGELFSHLRKVAGKKNTKSS